MVFTGNQTVKDLQVEISGDASDLEASLGQLRAGLEVAEQGLRGVEDEAEEAADELEHLSGSAAAASGSVAGLGATSSATSPSMFRLATSITAVVGAAGALVTILPGTIALIGSLAAAATGLAIGAGGVLGLGAAAAGAEDLKEALAEVKDNIVAMSAAVGGQFSFGETLLEGIRAIDDVFAQTLARVAPMLPQFAEAMEEFGSQAADAIPGLTAMLVNLGRQALPVLADFLSFMADKGPDAMRAILRTTRKLAPEISRLIDAFVRWAPVILDISTVVLDNLLPVLTAVIEASTAAGRSLRQFGRGNFLRGFAEGMVGQIEFVATLLAETMSVAIAESVANGIIDGVNKAISLTPVAQALKAAGVKDVQPVGHVDFTRKGSAETPTFDARGDTPGGVVVGPGGQPFNPRVAGGEAAGQRGQFKTIFDNILANTNTMADAATSSADANTTTASTLQDSALVQARDRCSLRQHLLDPDQRAARLPGGRASIGIGQPPADAEGLRPGARRAIDWLESQDTAEKEVVLQVGEKELARTTTELKRKHIDANIVTQ